MSLGRPHHDLNPLTFSSDGRLLQMEYADKAAKLGSTCIGMKVAHGIVIAGEKRNLSKLVEPGHKEKVFKVDEHIALAYSGVVGDGQRLLDKARERAQDYFHTYDNRITLRSMTQAMSDEALHFSDQDYRIDGRQMSRPYGVSVLLGGVDNDGPQLLNLECSGAFSKCKAKAIGAASEQVDKILIADDGYNPEWSLDEAKKQVLRLLKKVMPEAISPKTVELVTVATKEDRTLFKYADEKELQALIDTLPDENAGEAPH